MSSIQPPVHDADATDKPSERPKVDVPGLLDAIRTSLAAAFDPLRQIPHYGESGRAVENALRDVLLNHFPSRFGFRSGIVIGTDGMASHQSDLLIVDEMNCSAFLRTRETGIFPSGGVLGSIEVTTKIDNEKFKRDAKKIRILKELHRPIERTHWKEAPSGVLVAVEGPAGIETCAKWLSEALEEASEEEKRWTLPGCILILGLGSQQTGLVGFWDNTEGADRLSFNPETAAGICYFESGDALSVFLHCLMAELRRVAEERWKAVVSNFLIGPPSKRRSNMIEIGDETVDASDELLPNIIEAIGVGIGHFPEIVSYLSESLFERVGSVLKKCD